MTDTKIEWTDKTLFGALPKRCSKCRRMRQVGEFPLDRTRREGRAFVCRDCRYRWLTDGPTKLERRKMLSEGLAWCRGCRVWLNIAIVYHGRCKSCTREAERVAYAQSETIREKVKNRRDVRRRGVERMPTDAKISMMEYFDGQCAYCDNQATSWDHFVPVTRGGRTVPGNMLPACGSCNSRKKNRDPEEWLAIAPAVKALTVEYLTLAGTL